MTSKEMLGQLMDRHYADAMRAKEEGRLVAWATSISPQKLLETTELSISAVAEQTGFASAAHFRRVFHEVMGTGPLQYRKAHKK